MTITVATDSVPQMSPEARAFIERIARKPHPLLHKIIVAAGLMAEPLLYGTLYKKGFEQLERQGKEDVDLMISNHESFKDYVIQLVALYKSGRSLPEVGIGENLFKTWHGTLRTVFEDFGYRLHRATDGDEQSALEMMRNRAESEYELLTLLEGTDLFNYPGGGLTREGTVAGFKRTRLRAPLEAQLLSTEHGLGQEYFLGVMAIRHEVGAEFTSYGKKGFTAANKDAWRWKEIRRQVVWHKTGDVTLTLAPLIDIREYQERHPSTDTAKQSRCLAKDAHDLLLSHLPVMSTDAVAYAYAKLEGRGAKQVSMPTLESEVCAIISTCPVPRFEVAPNIKGMDGHAVTDRALSLLDSQRYPVFDVSGGIVSVREPHALMMYRNRAAQVIERPSDGPSVPYGHTA